MTSRKTPIKTLLTHPRYRLIQPFFRRKLVEKGIAFVRRTGLKVRHMDRGSFSADMPPKPNTNHFGAMYAGALFTLAEIPGGGLALTTFDSERFLPIVKELTLKFVRPAKGTITVSVQMPEPEIARIQNEADANGKAEFVLETELKNSVGEVVAVSRGVYQLRRLDQWKPR